VLNDLSRQMRLFTFVLGLGLGLILGCFAAVLDRPLEVSSLTVLGYTVVAFLAMAVTGTVMSVWLHRENSRFLDQAVVGSREIVTGAVSTVSVPGRVIQRQVLRGRPHFTMLAGERPGGGLTLPVTVVGEGPPRRVAVLAPALPALQRHASVVVALHPDRPEVGVLDDRVSAADLAAVAQDPRWAERLPSNGTIAGGWGKIVACALAGAVVTGVPVFALLT
jgi:hypothetical protein